jgi:formylglycine-generating enzyme required for sulfatase activity
MADQVRVFVSHHHSDQEDAFTARLVDELQHAGAVTWVDVADIRDGDFMERINTALSSSDWVVVVFTPASLHSKPVRTEVNAALNLVWQGRLRGVIPVVAEQCELAEIPPTWTTLQRYDAIRDYQTSLDGLLKALGLSLSPSSRAASTAPRSILPPLGPAPTPVGSTTTPALLSHLGFRGSVVQGVVCMLPPLCPVPGGVFTMGTDRARDEYVYDFEDVEDAEDVKDVEYVLDDDYSDGWYDESDEMPQHPVLVGDFSIGMYPVTVAEYACAVRAKVVPEPRMGTYDLDWAKQLQRLDHPVVCITWQDALAYVRWLAELTGQPWRLPTEAEWEKAARGTDGRIFPWGDAIDETKCNTNSSDLTATRVGNYPGGVSPYGVHDMSGNVCEWTSSLFKPYPYNQADGREEDKYSDESRVLRGGSWVQTFFYARAACRINESEYFHHSGVGFRLAWSAPGS